MKNTKKAFTLVELLIFVVVAIAILIGIVFLITKNVQNSNKEKYVDSAREYIEGVTNLIKAGEVKLYDWNSTYYFPLHCIPLEYKTADEESIFDSGYVVVSYAGNVYDYYFTGRDSSNTGIYLTYDGILDKDSVLSDVEKIDTTLGVGTRENIMRLSDNCEMTDFLQYEASSNIKERWKAE